MTDDSYSSSIEIDDNNANNNSIVDNVVSESESAPSEILQLRLPKLNMELSKTSIKQEEPESDHDFLYDKALNAPFKSSRGHIIKAFQMFDELRKRRVLCDVVLKTRSTVASDAIADPASTCQPQQQHYHHQVVYAHKVVLASCSPYFHAMFSGDMCEARASCVNINDVSHDALQLLVDFIYTCEIRVTEDNVQSLLSAANLLQLAEVKEACCEFLQCQLHPSNCLGIQRFADLHCCKDLLLYSKQYSENHFREIMKQDEFTNLPLEQLESLVSSNSLCAMEEEVFEAIRRWIKFDPRTRQQHLSRLFGHVRFPLLSREFLLQLTREMSRPGEERNSGGGAVAAGSGDVEEFIRSDRHCKDFLIQAMSYHLMSGEERSGLGASVPTTPRIPVTNLQVLMVIGGQAPKAVRSIEEYSVASEQWSQITELPSRRCRCGAVLLKGLLYVVGGFNGSLRVRSVDVYDPARDRWLHNTGSSTVDCSSSSSVGASAVAQMNSRRSTLGVASVGGLVYAVGGFDGAQGLSSVEVYDPASNLWRYVSAMSTRRSSVGVAVLGGALYAVGGYDGLQRECLASVERYDTATAEAEWMPLTPMSCRRSGAAVVALDGSLYAIGGHDGPSVRSSVEKYSPSTNEWVAVASMNYARRNAGAVSSNGRIYVIGGDDGFMNLRSGEYYDPSIDSWTLLPNSMMMGRSYAAVLLIPSSKRL